MTTGPVISYERCVKGTVGSCYTWIIVIVTNFSSYVEVGKNFSKDSLIDCWHPSLKSLKVILISSYTKLFKVKCFTYMYTYMLAATSCPGPSSEKGKSQKRKIAASNMETEDSATKSKRRRKNDGASGESDSQLRYNTCTSVII